VGFARGVFPRWVNVLGQQYGARPGALGEEADRHNREVFEELFKVVKLAWADEPFSFKGRYYQVPFPPEGFDWLPKEATARYGAPGELDEKGWLRKISPVPKPYQKPHPPLFQALSRTEATIRWAAREGVVPLVFLPFPERALQGARYDSEEADKAGRSVPLGRSIGLARMVYLGQTRDQALERAHNGSVFLFRQFHAKFEKQIPTAIEPFLEAGLAFAGTSADVTRRMAEVEQTLNPEWFMIVCDQGFMPIHEIKQQIEMFGTKVMPQFMG